VRKLACLVSPLALLAAMPAHADEADAPTALEGVVVTGRFQANVEVGKFDAPLAETPQAISVVTSAEFSQRGAQSLQETIRYVAGVNGEAYGNDGRGDYSRVRNVEAPIYLDGLRQTYGYYSPRTEIFMLDQVEVLKGPGGSLYGAGAIGGLINQTSKRPQFEAGGEVTASYGTWNRKQFGLDVTGPLNDAGTLAGRLVFTARNSDTQTDYIQDNRFLIAPSLTWRATEDTDITLLARYQKDNGGSVSTFPPYMATLLAPPGKRLPTSRLLGEPSWEKFDTETKTATLLIEHRFSDALTFRSRTRYMEAHVDYQSIYPAIANPQAPFIDADQRMLNRYIWAIYPDQQNLGTDNHVQAKFDTGPISHSLMAGVDYIWFKQKSDAIFGTVAPIDAYAPVYGNYEVPAGYRNPTERQDQLGFYIQDHIEVGDRLSFTLGARRDRAESKIEGGEDQVDKATTYRAAALVKLDYGLAPYVSYTESFLPQVGTTFAGKPFDPTEGKQWEVGLKWSPTPEALITLAAYKITERNRLTPDPVNPNFSVQTGEAELKGIELEGTFKVAGFDISAAGTLADTEVTESNNPVELGRPLEGAAEKQASVFVSRAFQVADETTLRLGGGLRYIGESWSGDLRTPGYTLGDLYAAVDWREWSFQLNANNVTDKIYYSTCLQRGDCFLGVRRTVNFAVSRSF
jgi:iron complex outermembrane recepter protein